MKSAIQAVASDVASRIPSMAMDNPINNTSLIASLIEASLQRDAKWIRGASAELASDSAHIPLIEAIILKHWKA